MTSLFYSYRSESGSIEGNRQKWFHSRLYRNAEYEQRQNLTWPWESILRRTTPQKDIYLLENQRLI